MKAFENILLQPTDFQLLLAELKKHMSKPVERPMSKEETCKFLGRGMTTLQRLMAKGMPFHRLNGRPVFFASEINSWIKTKK